MSARRLSFKCNLSILRTIHKLRLFDEQKEVGQQRGKIRIYFKFLLRHRVNLRRLLLYMNWYVSKCRNFEKSNDLEG